MNGFELRALLWVIFMNRKLIAERDMEDVHKLYYDLVESASVDRKKADFTTLITRYHGMALSADTTNIARRLTGLLARIVPDAFTLASVKKRNRTWLITACVHFTLCVVITQFSAGPTMPTLAFVFLLLGLVSLVPTIILFQTSGLLERFAREKDTPKSS